MKVNFIGSFYNSINILLTLYFIIFLIILIFKSINYTKKNFKVIILFFFMFNFYGNNVKRLLKNKMVVFKIYIIHKIDLLSCYNFPNFYFI